MKKGSRYRSWLCRHFSNMALDVSGPKTRWWLDMEYGFNWNTIIAFRLICYRTATCMCKFIHLYCRGLCADNDDRVLAKIAIKTTFVLTNRTRYPRIPGPSPRPPTLTKRPQLRNAELCARADERTSSSREILRRVVNPDLHRCRRPSAS